MKRKNPRLQSLSSNLSRFDGHFSPKTPFYFNIVHQINRKFMLWEMWRNRFRFTICMKNGLPYGDISVLETMVNWTEKICIYTDHLRWSFSHRYCCCCSSVAYEAYVINKEYSSGKLFSFEKVAHQSSMKLNKRLQK